MQEERESRVSLDAVREAEQKLKNSEQRLRAVLQALPDILIVFDTQGRYQEVLTSKDNLLYDDFEKLKGKRISDVLPTPPGQQCQAALDQTIETRQPQSVVYELEVIEGQRWFEGRTSPIYDDYGNVESIIWVARDLTEYIQAEDKLRKNEELLNRMQQIAQVGGWELDVASHTLFVTPEIATICGKTPFQELSREEAIEYFAPHHRHIIEHAVERCITCGKPWDVELEFITAQGRHRWVRTIGQATGFKLPAEKLSGTMQDITDRKRTEQAMRESEKRYRTLFECGTEGFLLFRDVFQDCNEQAAKIWGCTRQDIIGKSPMDFSPETQPDGRNSAQAAQAIIKDAMNGIPKSFYWQHRRKDGSLVDTAISLKVLPLGGEKVLLASMRDITKFKQATEQLEKNQEYFRHIIQHSPSAMVLLDINGNVELINEKFEQLFGYRMGDITHVDQWWERVYPEQHARKQAMDYWQKVAMPKLAAGEEPAPVERDITCRDGKIRNIQFRYTPLGERIIILLTDFTERKQAEEKRLEMESQMQHAQKLESLGVLAGGIAHDFNNLLTSILGNAELATMEVPPGAAITSSLEEIKQAAIRASELSSQMLAYAGKGRYVITDVDMNDLIQKMGHLVKVSLSKKVKLILDFEPNLPPVRADASQMRQIVMNLVTNASDAIGDNQGKVTIKTSTQTITEDSQPSNYLGEKIKPGTYLSLAVTDDGCGMDEETMGKLFDPFFSTKFTGRGLGLAAVHGIVKGHEGTIVISSKPGEGSTFQVLLPCAESSPQIKKEGDGMVKKGTILIADDEELIANLTRKFLEQAGYDVIWAQDGQEAVDTFAKQSDQITATIMDLNMPVMKGNEALAKIRQIKPNAKIIFTSGLSQHEAELPILNDPNASFLAKPFLFKDLIDKLKEVLGQAE